MVFDARAATEKAEVEYPPFEFVGLDGGTYTLRSIALVGADDLTALANLFRQAENEDGEDVDEDDLAAKLDGTRDLLARAASDEASAEAVNQLGLYVLGQLMAAWQQSSSTESGKSERPSSATKKQGRPSKRTRKPEVRTSTVSKSAK